MSTLSRFLFPAPAERSAARIFMWWESRRLAYNAIMAAAGTLSLGLITLIGSLPPGTTQPPPLPLVLLFGVFANVCYSFGPFVEYALELIWPRKLLPTGPALFRMGLTFSLGLTALPVMAMGWDWLIRLATWLL